MPLWVAVGRCGSCGDTSRSTNFLCTKKLRAKLLQLGISSGISLLLFINAVALLGPGPHGPGPFARPQEAINKVETAASAALPWPASDPQQRHRLVRGRGSTGRPLEKPTGAAFAPRHAPALLGSQRVSRTARRSRAGAALGPHDLFPAGQPPPHASLRRPNGPVKTCSQRPVARTARTHASAVGVPHHTVHPTVLASAFAKRR